MQTISIELPDTAFAALRKTPEEFIQEMRIAAAVKWYELGELSQGTAAEVAALSRTDFIAALAKFKVSPLQYTLQELSEELGGAN
jgi:predicted HTH domain antitoxin